MFGPVDVTRVTVPDGYNIVPAPIVVPSWHTELLEQIKQLRAEIDALKHEMADWRSKK